MTRLASLRSVHPYGRHLESAAILGGVAPTLIDRRSDAAFAPDVPVVHVVIIGDHCSRDAAEQISVRPAEHVPLAQVVQECLLEWRGLDTEPAVTFVVLVA